MVKTDDIEVILREVIEDYNLCFDATKSVTTLKYKEYINEYIIYSRKHDKFEPYKPNWSITILWNEGGERIESIDLNIDDFSENCNMSSEVLQYFNRLYKNCEQKRVMEFWNRGTNE